MNLQAIHVFPVKSCRGLSPTEAEVGDRGFEGDRRFMLVDAERQFLSQRRLPTMALLHTAFEGARLRLTGPGVALELPARPAGGEARRVRIWDDEVDAWSLGPEAAGALSAFLGLACELVYMPDSTERPVDTDWAPAGYRVGFADGFPYLLTTTASLAELGRRGADVEMLRFRPNLVVDGAEPFAEDGWQQIRIGDVRFSVVKPCARCTIPNVDPATAEVGVEPTRTLVGFRKLDGQVRFGHNLIAQGRGRVRVGDPVVVLSAREA
jgi:uncharacterized protein YcbX